MTIEEFIEARIAEDQENAACDGVEEDGHGMCYYWSERRERDIEAQREIASLHTAVTSLEGVPLWCVAEDHLDYPCDTLRALASTWRDHEDYDEGWKP